MSKKIKCALLSCALAAVVTVSAAFSACAISTSHPRAKITISFNEIDYVLDYTLYRNMYPQTVQHFIELADADFYDGMIIHNYGSVDWFTGAYNYVDDEETGYAHASANNAFAEYLESAAVDKEQQYYDLAADGTLTPTVYTRYSFDKDGKPVVSADDKLPTLIGEFSDNKHIIDNGALTSSAGCLKMYYYSKGDANQPAVVKNSFNQVLDRDYKYNCATSVFSMQVTGGSSYQSTSYCVFAQLTDDAAQKVLKNLLDAIENYRIDVLGGATDKLTSSVTVTVDNLDTFAKEGGRGIEQTFSVPTIPIIVKSVDITKY